MITPSGEDCTECERLRRLQQEALARWVDAGGNHPTLDQRTAAMNLKEEMDDAMEAVLRHRKEHGR